MNLENYYRINFSLQQHHNWAISMVENMIPMEREIYIILLTQYIEEEKSKMENNH